MPDERRQRAAPLDERQHKATPLEGSRRRSLPALPVIDSHAHLDFCGDETVALVERARDAGVRRILTVGTDAVSIASAIEASRNLDEVYAAVGCHPHNAGGFCEDDLRGIERAAAEAKVRAIGETGLDYYRDLAPRDDQRRAFVAQIGLARRLNLPLVVHMRAAEQEAFKLLAEHGEGVSVVLHCFSTPGRVEECVERGYHCSFAGNVTYPKATDLKDAARAVPPNLLLVETDSPFLAPQEIRGKPNEPARVRTIAEFMAGLKDLSYEQLEDQIEANAERLFQW